MTNESVRAETVAVNGEPFPFKEQSVHDMLVALGIDPARQGIAVAMNGDIVSRNDWASAMLKAGDRIEVIHAVAGG